MRQPRFKLDTSFFLGAVYFFIALATFKHTMWAGSTVFEGAYPVGNDTGAQFWWWVTGVLVAIGIDVGMMTAAHVLTKPKGRMKAFVFTLAFIIAAFASLMTQVMYSSSHTATFEFGPGVTPYWRSFLQPLIDARPVLMAAFLPLFAVVYTMARITVHENPVAIATGPDENQGTVGVDITAIRDKLLVNPGKVAKPKAVKRIERGRQMTGKIAVAKKLLEDGDPLEVSSPEPKPKATAAPVIPEGEILTFPLSKKPKSDG